MTDFSDINNDELNDVEYLKTLELSDYLKCEKTRNILLDEHYLKYEQKLEKKLIDIYEKYNSQYQDIDCLFSKDLDAIDSHAFASMIYNFITIDYDLTIFYECPGLAKDLLK